MMAWLRYWRLLARYHWIMEERDRLILAGVDPADLPVPMRPVKPR